MNTIDWSRKAVKQLRKITSGDQVRIYDAVQVLAQMPDVHNVRALLNHPQGYRLRVGNYRVLFDWDGGVKIVHIEEIRKRDEHTY
ncbi:type II toxin-antitoxin system RelE/ParE family toxin [Pseudomonas sp. SWRI107]|uniref:type II toxin-antitoxin system RelE family toxin n=1 Tax=Pseudomonas TaxID=286 RepID=UPI001647B87C|nr:MULTISPECIES: type II toxin-antitoxin system RelE/ParE family toxin [Pseudomonas]MBC3410104.1 type II toxin-antitoxin system RelE/ParE family toxin [Pseudomonas sp. SWRI51]MBV4533289.1 type II toxin-antitoxin system RelE/ParE family toxin [Pseudomonas farsensis]